MTFPAQHVKLFSELQKLLQLKEKMDKMAIERAKYEGIDKDPRVKNADGDYYGDLQRWATFKLAYYQCYKCHNPYFGGMKDCLRAQ